MANASGFSLQGLDGALDKMKTLAPKLKRSGLRKASRKAMNIVRDAARAAAKNIDDPETAEKIWRNIVTQEAGRQSKREGGVVMRVGILGGAKDYSNVHTRKGGRRGTYAVGGDVRNPGGDTFHWRFIEFGTEFIPAAPFMRPAMETNTEAVTNRFSTELRAEIDKALGGA
ncbi:HK97-gp10 family putative phage morphogenesis protein [Pseudomonas brenneri]|uniref:HK97-gp10 family putative phage morphogenesis protein n=1 Tax=Pseudomonas brenneri TaxID=129817 RepID=UPI0028D13343|nr:HK97-gp10 family putative phage morphogenesis protein [Pseudomonas brenneri]